MSENQAGAPQLVKQQLEEFRRDRAKIAAAAEAENARIDKEFAKIQKRILQGKATTGDRITDYFAARGILDDSEVSKPFRDLESKMAGKKGELFLVVRRERKRHVFGMPGHSSESDYHLETEAVLGMLSDEKLVLDIAKWICSLPTESYAEVSMSRPSEKSPGPFHFRDLSYGLHNLGEIVSARHESGAALEIHIGDKEVFTYAPYHYAGGRTHRPRDWIITLNQTARMLGKDIPEAPEEKAAQEEEQKEVLAQLDKKREEYKRLRKQDPLYPRDIEECEKALKMLLGRAKELKLDDEPMVQLVARELKVASR